MEHLVTWYLDTHRMYMDEVRRNLLGEPVRIWYKELQLLEDEGKLKYGQRFMTEVLTRLRDQDQ